MALQCAEIAIDRLDSSNRNKLESNVDSDDHLPILLDVERPLETKMLLLIIVHKARDGIVVATRHHTVWSGLWLELLLVLPLVGRVW